METKRIVKSNIKTTDGPCTIFAFELPLKKFKGFVMVSAKKWHKGKEYTKAPIWFGKIDGKMPALFVWNYAFGVQKNP